jgi:hypothetical protein
VRQTSDWIDEHRPQTRAPRGGGIDLSVGSVAGLAGMVAGLLIHEGTRDIQGVISGNDTMAVGIAAALKGAGRSDVIVVGFDGSPDALDAIRAGEMKATALQPAVRIARMAVDQADRFMRSGSTGLPEKQSIDCLLVTPENADEFGVFELLRGPGGDPEPESPTGTE